MSILGAVWKSIAVFLVYVACPAFLIYILIRCNKKGLRVVRLTDLVYQLSCCCCKIYLVTWEGFRWTLVTEKLDVSQWSFRIWKCWLLRKPCFPKTDCHSSFGQLIIEWQILDLRSLNYIWSFLLLLYVSFGSTTHMVN